MVFKLVALVAHEDDGRGGQYAYQRRGQVVRCRNGELGPEFLRVDSRVRVAYDERPEQGYPRKYGSQNPDENTDTFQPNLFCVDFAHLVPLDVSFSIQFNLF